MATPDNPKVHATINGRRYTASLSGASALIIAGGRALPTADYADGRFTRIRPTPPDFVVQMPDEDLDVLDRLAEQLRAAGADARAEGAAG